MKHPVRDRILIFVCALCALCGAVCAVALVMGRITFDPAIEMMERASLMGIKTKAVLIAAAVLLVLLALLLIGITLPSRKKRSSSFAIQQNENGTVRISLKALESLVQRCLNQHAELKVVTSSLYSDEESIRVDVHITLQSDISMPLAISALQKQIKRYLEACSGVTVKEVRVFVDGTTPPSDKGEQSPYAIPASLLGLEAEALPVAGEPEAEPAAREDAFEQEAPVEAAVSEEEPAEENGEEPREEEAGGAEESADEDGIQKDEGDWA